MSNRGHAPPRVRRLLLSLLAVSALLPSPRAAAEELTLERTLELATSGNPAISVAAARTAAQRGGLRQAGVRPNPRVSLGGGLDEFTLLSSVEIGVSQTFELGGKRQARVDVAQSDLEATEVQQADTLRTLRLEVKEAFARVLAAQESERLQRELLEAARRQVAVAQARLDLGEAPGVDVVRLGVEVSRREAAAARAAGERLAALAGLGRLIGVVPDVGLEGELGRPLPLPTLEALQEQALAERPDLAAARLRILSGERGVRLQESQGVSDLTVRTGLAYERLVVDGDSFQPPGSVTRLDDPGLTALLQFEMPLPIFDTNEGNIERARALAEVGRAERLLLERAVASQVGQAYRRLEAARAARQTLREQALPQARRALDIVQEGFSLGVQTLADLVQARDAYLAVAVEENGAALAEELALSELEAAVGRDLALPSTPDEAPKGVQP